MIEPQGKDPIPLPAAIDGPTDGDLVRLCLTGQKIAFDKLIVKYQKQAVAVSYRLLGNTHDALEVTQEAFLKAYTNLSTLEKPEAFGGWLMRIVSNLSLNHRRSRKNRGQLPLDDLLGISNSGSSHGGAVSQASLSEWASQSDDPAVKMQSKELGVKLQDALNQLPEKQRHAIVLFTIQELPQKDVAELLGCSVEAVKWHVFQGRKKLRELLKDQME